MRVWGSGLGDCGFNLRGGTHVPAETFLIACGGKMIPESQILQATYWRLSVAGGVVCMT